MEKTEKIEKVKSIDDLEGRLQTVIAGDTIVWNDFERYMTRAKPITLRMIIKAVKVESYLNATQDKVLSPGMKIALGTIFAIAIVVAVVWLIFKGGM